jgi:hypothetical protein
MFAGLGISIDNGSGAQTYTATGAYPYLGYVTVIWAGYLSRGQPQGDDRHGLLVLVRPLDGADPIHVAA